MRLLAVAVVVAGLLVACGGDDGEDVRADAAPATPTPPDRAPDCAGPVSLVTNRAVRIDEGTGVLTALQARVDDATDVLRRSGNDYETAAIEDVQRGDQVEIWVDGPVAESHPAQAHADVVLLP